MVGKPVRTIVQALEDVADIDSRGFRFLDEGPAHVRGTQIEVAGAPRSVEHSFREVHAESRARAAALQEAGLRKGDRVAMILPTGEDFVFSFFGALQAGIVPVPIYPPLSLGQLSGYLDNARHVIAKAGCKAVLTTKQIKNLLGTVQASCPDLRSILSVEEVKLDGSLFRPVVVAHDDLAFLQFTSGSTSRPKGVCLTHGNLGHNIRAIMEEGLEVREGDVAGSWLPLYHDMGLIGFVLAPLFYARAVTYLPPLLFLKRPLAWLQMMSRAKASIAYAPNFAYALTVKRVREKDLAGLDLSSWRIAGCGAEPIRPETLDDFSRFLAPAGFPRTAFIPSYGMAESSLAIAFQGLGHGMETDSVVGETLFADGVAQPCEPDHAGAVRLVSCGGTFLGHELRVTDVATGEVLGERKVGELSIRGPSVMGRYWDDEVATRDSFVTPTDGGDPWLRTGDLGYVASGRVLICGRLKELIIVHGKNYYPQDLEWEASEVAGVRKGNVVAFGTRARDDEDREAVVVVAEVTDSTGKATRETEQSIEREIRARIQEVIGLKVDEVVLAKAGTLPKTSSGKLQRAATRRMYEDGSLDPERGRGNARVELAKNLVKSQLSFLKLAVMGGPKK
ncbi:MAG: fatty acyl-AMP ligase [Deltaproteobacteria bacterium]|nr:fatty acyl-AMP ligase [Deltaproteobacteria bacterium]